MTSRTSDESSLTGVGSKRLRVDNGLDPSAPAYLSSAAAAASASAAAAATAGSSTSAQAVPHSAVLTSSPPSWASELPAFLDGVSQHEPSVPDEVVQHLLERSGCNCNDPKLVRLVALAAQHFLFDVLHDARQYQKLRSKDKTNTELTLADLSSSLQNHGVALSRAEYFADHPYAGGMVSAGAAVAPQQNNLAHAGGGGGGATKKEGRKK